jgi:cyclophilin family peptidyl-prolyl cis-trans isomerase
MKKRILIALGVVILGGIVYFSGLGGFLKTSLLNVPETVTLETNLGNIVIRLYTDEAPNLTENFTELASAGKYDGTIFHRVIKGFMIQGGDFENFNGTGGTSADGGLLADEISLNLSHVRGAVSMANRGPNTNGSQFFIVQEDSKFLDGRHSVIGQVVEGMDVVDRIASVPTDLEDKPLEKVTVLKVQLP